MEAVSINDKRYPEILKRIDGQAPKLLYCKGNLSTGIFDNCLAVIGSRRLTSYGRKMTEQLVTEIAASGITIVSGFMYGGDEVAHRSAVEIGGKTIAVMPCGINIIHPEYQEDLYNKILKNKGLIISEFDGDFPPAIWTYPKRNRIVAGLSRAALIVEAGLNSGTLITAEFAKKFKRKIFAVPGPLTSDVSKGTVKLIKEGATVVTSAKDVINFYFSKKKKIVPKICNRFQRLHPNNDFKNLPSNLEGKIIKQLQREPMEIDVLVRNLNMPASEISSILSLMQLKGIVEQEGNKYYVNQSFFSR